MKQALHRYLFYYSRYANHARSSELERVRERALQHMQDMERTEATSAEVQFIGAATDRLVEVKRVHV